MQTADSLAGNSESQDFEDKSRDEDVSNPSQSQNISITSGYYDAEKCRAHIANQIRVSKIDRFASQVTQAIEVEIDVHSRLSKVLNMFTKKSSRVVYDFAVKCRQGSQRHRQDRILNQAKNGTKKLQIPATISNDLLYGEGAHLVQELLDQAIIISPPKHIKRRKKHRKDLDTDLLKVQEIFEPNIIVEKLEISIAENIRRSEIILSKLGNLQQSFKDLASEHRNKVDYVHAAEEERQASTVIRRSAYNLSMAAIKAVMTPIGAS